MPAGRPTKLTPETQSAIVEAVRAGNYIETAAALAGVSKQIMYRWMRKGARSKYGRHRQFVDAIKRAMAEAEAEDLEVIRQAGETNWQARAWRLERKFPDRWGRKERVEHSTRRDKPLEIREMIVYARDETVPEAGPVPGRNGTH